VKILLTIAALALAGCTPEAREAWYSAPIPGYSAPMPYQTWQQPRPVNCVTFSPGVVQCR